MSLTTCPDCSNRVSTDAPACPFCGRQLQHESPVVLGLQLVGVLCSLVVCALVAWLAIRCGAI